jgi:hypothetical protein
MSKCTCSKYPFGLICPSCSDKQERKANNLYVKKMEYLENYGMVSSARLDELNRRHLVFDKDGSEHLVRVGENGKLQDRYPDYY